MASTKLNRKILLDKTPGAFQQKYKLGGVLLGKGSFARVEMATEIQTGFKFAVKIIPKRGLKKTDENKIIREIGILRTLRHMNIVKIEDAYEDKDNFYVCMEYVGGGELHKKIHDEVKEYFNEQRIREVILTCAEALKYCNEKGIVHRDIKPANILLTTPELGSKIKIVDFNLSKAFEESVGTQAMETQVGTMNFVAPEVILGKPYDFKVDVWSLGVVLFLMLSGGYLPFNLEEHSNGGGGAAQMDHRNGNWSFEPEDSWKKVSTEAKNLVKNMMHKNPQSRFDWNQVIGHPWFKVANTSI